MSLVQARINGVAGLQKLIATKQKDLTRLQTELATRTKLLQEEIAKGGTTGDTLRDKVIGVYGLDDEILAQFRALQERLAGKKGEFVLIRYFTEVRERFGGEIRETDFRSEKRFRIGLLQAEALCVPAKRKLGLSQGITLPVERYLAGVWEWGGLRLLSSDTDEPVISDLFEWIEVGDQPPLLVEYMTDKKLSAELFIGDEAVRAELVKTDDEKFFATAAKYLGRLILQPTD